MRSSRDSSDGRDGRHRESRREDRDRRNSSLTSPSIKRTKTSTHSMNASKESPNSSSSSGTSVKTLTTTNSQREKLSTDKYDCYKISMDAIRAEEEEAINNSNPTEDLKEFHSKCDSIRDICREVLEVKSGNQTNDSNNSNNSLESLRMKGSLVFLALKMLNRFDKYRCREAKDKLQTAKQKVDTFHLQLQNMLYEVMHLQKESNTCQAFRSKDETIQLVPKEQFVTEGPEDLKQKNVDSHTLHLARLEWELRQRKQLEEQVKSAESVKKLCEEEIVTKRETLEKLQPMLKSIVEATQPLYSQLNIPLQANDSTHALAQYLPRPLYVLYVQIVSYRHASEANFTVKIIGNVEDVKLFELNSKDEEEEDNEEQDEEELQRKTKKSRHRKSVSAVTAKTSGFNKLVASHPLSIEISFNNNESTLSLSFRYILRLEIVSVKVSVKQTESLNHNEVIDESLLCHLLSKTDDGLSSPNPANDYIIKSYGIENFSSLVSQIGFGYEWCQRLSGLDFISRNPKNICNSLSISSMDLTVKAIIERFRSRLILQQQLCELDRSLVSLPKELLSLTSSQINCIIKEFKELNKEEFLSISRLTDAINLDIVDIDDSFLYKARLERGFASMSALILIPFDYPKIPPFIHLSVTSLSDRKNTSDSSLRELEELLNCWCPKSTPESCLSHVLSYQMHSLQWGFDIYLEANQCTSTGTEGPKEFSQKKIFTKLVSGRDHCISFHYDTKYNVI